MSLLNRWWKKVTELDPGACWEWEGTVNNKGYGIMFSGEFTEKGHPRPALAHRVAFELFKGSIPAGQYVCHECDNPSCVNPNHLWLGSARDNWRDAVSKGRMKENAFEGLERPPGPPTRKSDGLHTAAKITPDDVRAIRNDSRVKTVGGRKELAEEFDMSYMNVYSIYKRKSWKNIE